MNILTEMLFSLDYENNTEKVTFRYANEYDLYDTREHEYVEETHLYGTMLLDISESASLFIDIVHKKYDVEVNDVDEFIKCVPKFTRFLKKFRPEIAAIPDRFALLRERSLRTIDALLEWEKPKYKSQLANIIDAYNEIFACAIKISEYAKQIEILFDNDVFSKSVLGAPSSPVTRWDAIYRILGIGDQKYMKYSAPTSAPTGSNVGSTTSEGFHMTSKLIPDLFDDATGSLSFLFGGEVKQKLILTEYENRHRYDLCYYVDYDMQGTILAYIFDMVNNNAMVRKCKNCGRYFIAKGKAIYCERTIDPSGNTCRKTGPTESYKSRLRDSPANKAYRQEYKNNFGRMSKGTITKEEFEDWKQLALQFREDVNNGIVPIQDFLDWLKYGD